MALRARIRIGTSGWSYPHWRGVFYPDGLPASRELDFYAEHFGSVEINNTFYRLAERGTLELWHDRVPPDFVFSIKASRYITHMKKLKDPAASTARFFEPVGALGGKRGPVLFQLPPGWRFNARRLAEFLAVLPGDGRYTFEFRDRSWLNDDCFELLRQRGAALCIYDLAGYTSPKEITTDFVYVRLHGPGAAYGGCYDKQVLSGWAGALSAWSAKGLDIYCYFNNDEAACAVMNAQSVEAMLTRS